LLQTLILSDVHNDLLNLNIDFWGSFAAFVSRGL
jgi:hypothetical protein